MVWKSVKNSPRASPPPPVADGARSACRGCERLRIRRMALDQAVLGKLFVVPAGALPVPVSGYIGLNRQSFSG
jgi:hypothetical protein